MKTVKIFLLLGLGAMSLNVGASLFEAASQSLKANIIELEKGPVMRAGSYQFASLWTRDFCFASRGLWAIEREDVIASHLSRLLNQLRATDGLVPRVLDSKPSWQRVLRYSVVPFRPISPDVKDHLRAEYLGEHDTVAIDSNALVLITAFEYVSRSGDMNWFYRHQERLKAVLDFYRPYFVRGLVEQEKYGDWQDSVKREGATFFTNFLVWKALKSYAQYDYFDIDQKVVALFRKNLDELFFDQDLGLYRSLLNGPWVSLEGLLFAIEDEDFLSHDKRMALYQNLKQHPLWLNPGVATYPSYPKNQISLTTKSVGLRHYHDGLVWPWLTAFAAKTAYKMNDKVNGKLLEEKLSAWASRDGAINEVLDPKKKMRPVRRMFYTSEAPFSWGAGFVLDLLVKE